MSELLEILQQEWAIRALIASSLVGVMCGVLGCFIVLRNMSLVGDALAHAILPGVVFAFVIVGYSALGFFTGAVIAGLLTALGITWIQHNVGTKNDAAIGIVFTAMFSIGVMGISYISRNEGVHLDLKDFLFGNVLGVANSDLYLTTGVTVYVVISVIVFYRYLFVSTFQPVIAETMGIPVQLIHYFLMLLLSFAVVASLQNRRCDSRGGHADNPSLDRLALVEATSDCNCHFCFDWFTFCCFRVGVCHRFGNDSRASNGRDSHAFLCFGRFLCS